MEALELLATMGSTLATPLWGFRNKVEFRPGFTRLMAMACVSNCL